MPSKKLTAIAAAALLAATSTAVAQAASPQGMTALTSAAMLQDDMDDDGGVDRTTIGIVAGVALVGAALLIFVDGGSDNDDTASPN
jgi:hypothetical protein